MIRLASQANIAQVLAELKEYATEVDVDFVRKAVRAIGRCAIKVEQSAEKCVATLLDLIQTKVNYVVQEAIVVIKDIFRKYPNKYESIISTLCENLDTLDEPEARGSMIWIIGEYAERIDNADELLESFLEGFHDENPQVQLQLLTAIVKLFLKRPTETQELVQQVLSLATQDSDNPDLRDRGFIYWRLLSTDPVAAKEVVLAEKPLISEETDLLEPTLLDELICHIGSLASVYHKPPSAFVEGKTAARKSLPPKTGSGEEGAGGVGNGANNDSLLNTQQSTVIPAQNSLIDDLLNLDLNAPATTSYAPTPTLPSSSLDILGGGLDTLLGGPLDAPLQSSLTSATNNASNNLTSAASNSGLLGDLFGVGPTITTTSFFAPPKQLWLPASKGKGLELNGTFTRRNGEIVMEMRFQNNAMQAMTNFAIQLNKNSFGLAPSNPLSIGMPIQPNNSYDVNLTLNNLGPVQKMNPLTNLQVAIKNNIDVFYFSCVIPLHIFCTENGAKDKREFLSAWKEIPSQNEVQFNLDIGANTIESLQNKLQSNNVFTIANRHVDGQDMLYQSFQLVNSIWILTELKIQPGNSQATLSIKCRSLDVAEPVHKMYELLINI